MPKPVTSQTVTIPAGESVSTVVDLTSGNLVLLMAPREWTPANVSFLVSIDGVEFVDLRDADGGELARALQANAAATVSPERTLGVSYLRIRSGTRERPVAQQAARILVCAIA